ncbi:mechanosensitive ion channel family protein [Flavobacterium sp.]|uniref:mechanosensitive ion channel family protein n=1 Tax=Flavobacterium sp. TaxID=239 RepID=UPI0025C5CD47|nr:mechanosensitive ion channel family protein [Flavobacterium sp.]
MHRVLSSSKNQLHIAVFFFLLFLSTIANAQSLLPGESEEQKVAPTVAEDSLGRQTPRGAVSGFFKAVADQKYSRASQYMELSRGQRSERQRTKLVKSLQSLLDHGGDIMPYSWISNTATGRLDDELDPDADLVGSVTYNGKLINLFVTNTGKDDAPVWRFSAGTINEIAGIRTADPLLVDRILPEALRERLVGGVPLGHWLAVIILIIVAYLFSWALVALICFLLHALWSRARVEHVDAAIKALNLPVRLYLSVWVFAFLSQQAGISIIIRQRLSTLTVIIGILAILILFWRGTDYFGDLGKQRFTRLNRASAVSITLFLRRTIKGAIIVFGVIAILGTFGVDVRTGIAALGIGGLALALGAQKTIENFVGSVTLIADQPLRVGDLCKVGEHSGTVEQIGMRSTKLRTGERTVVTIPNGDLAATRIENLQHRDRFHFHHIFQLRTETTPAQLRTVLRELRATLDTNKMVFSEGKKVRFTGIGQGGYKVEVTAYVSAPNFDTFQEVQEGLLLSMMDVIVKSGTFLVLSSQTVYLQNVRNSAADESPKSES